jgi:hypothetical protein
MFAQEGFISLGYYFGLKIEAFPEHAACKSDRRTGPAADVAENFGGVDRFAF